MSLFYKNIPYVIIEELNTVYILAKKIDKDIIIYLVVKSKVTPSGEIVGPIQPHPISCKNWKLGLSDKTIKIVEKKFKI